MDTDETSAAAVAALAPALLTPEAEDDEATVAVEDTTAAVTTANARGAARGHVDDTAPSNNAVGSSLNATFCSMTRIRCGSLLVPAALW